jgi:hypothetical protein
MINVQTLIAGADSYNKYLAPNEAVIATSP